MSFFIMTAPVAPPADTLLLGPPTRAPRKAVTRLLHAIMVAGISAGA
jgi:hypothetical protein